MEDPNRLGGRALMELVGQTADDERDSGDIAYRKL